MTDAHAGDEPETPDAASSTSFVTAPSKQPSVDGRFRTVALAARQSLHSASQYLIGLPNFPTELEKSVWMWHTSLTTLAWDVSELAISAALDSSTLRGARSTNRMLLEYAARVHLYIASPGLAREHVNESSNMLRRVMKPVAGTPADAPGVEAVKVFVESGTTKASQPRTREMMAAMVATFVADPSKREPFIDFLDAEYAMGSGYVHGSQSSFFDIFDGSKNLLHPRTRVLHRKSEVLRCINCILALLVGIESHYKVNFGVQDHVAALKNLGPYEDATSMGTHDTLMLLLGIQ
jgi:hypothetical protein